MKNRFGSSRELPRAASAGGGIDEFDLLEPWEGIVSADQAEQLEQQCLAEVTERHELFGRIGRALARRRDRDDVLYELTASAGAVAVVHLTWNAPDASGKFPSFELFKSLRDWRTSMHEAREE